jgi:5'(3')-deoxyribonucleotidase
VSRRPRILLDVDGPLTRTFFDRACALLREHGVPAQPNQIDRWNIFESFGAGIQVEQAVRARLERPGVACGFLPNDGAREFLAELRTWADVYAVTAPLDGSETWTYDREVWLREELGFKADRVVHARDKRLVAGDAFVDDKHSSVASWSREYPSGLAILWRESHNAADAWAGPSARTYDELRAYLDALRGP